MKILMVCQHFYPEQFRINDICFELALRGHEVTVLTGLPNYPEGRVFPGYHAKAKRDETVRGVRIIRTFLWILGLLTLVSGIVGVSNIMLIAVKERTHEFGIRKAIGASPAEILKLIIAESVTITAIFGYIGMFLGMIACQIMDKTVGQRTVDIGMDIGDIRMLVNPTVGLDVALEATILLIVAGTIAGAVPAWKAARVKPIEALRAE